MRSSSSRGIPGPRSADPQQDRGARRCGRARPPALRPAKRPEFSSTLASARSSWAGVRLDQRQVRLELDVEAARRRRRPSRWPPAPPPRPSTSRCAARRRPPEAATGRAGCRPAATGARSRRDHRGQLARAASSTSVSEASPPAAVVIAVSGERRSWETERSSGRLDHVAAPQRLRLDHLRLELVAPACRDHERLERGDDAVLEGVEHHRVGVSRHQHRADPARRRRSAAARAGARRCRPRRARPTRRQAVRLRDPLADRPQRLLDAAAAEQQPCHLRGQVGLAAPRSASSARAARRAGERARDQPRRRRTRRAPPSSRRRRW